MLIKSFLTEQAKQARHRSEAQRQEALDLEHRAQQLRRSAADNEAMAEELDRLAGQYADVFDPAEYSPKGAAGTEVQHADGEQGDEKIRFAWVPCAHASEQQRIGAVGEHNGLCAIRLEDLTPEQQAKVDREELLVSEM